ncbi:ABC transporter substrate-binding protein [Streptomyces sp. NPDC059740]|uniref:ABC transporter substrate-binding protein n=1 Tax=Streptomyces sp. NPDC059740 TaxID=3346926 RepID=UPI003661D5F4
MRTTRAAAATAVVVATLAAATACGGGTSSGGDNSQPKQLTYWASNQAATPEDDVKILTPELKKFEKQTGIKVKLEVIPWADLLNRITAATSSGQGPDVLNIGNTWSSSLQATGALLPFDDKTFAKIGGKSRFVKSAMASTGAAGQDPAAVPLYSLGYGLYYNKARFKEAGIAKAPTTWDELVADGKKLTKDGKYGLAVEGSNLSENAHHAFILGKQHGADFFDAKSRPTFTTPGAVAAVKQYVDFLAADKIAAPGNAEYSKNQSINDLATGKAAMLLWQNARNPLKADGMKDGDWGVAPMPVQSGEPGTGKQVNNMAAGINLSVFKNTKNLDGALKFVKFMTSNDEQKVLCNVFGAVPPVTAVQADDAFQVPDLKVMAQELNASSAALPQVANESQFETEVGTAIKNLLADAAAGRSVTTESVKAELTKAQQKMPTE